MPTEDSIQQPAALRISPGRQWAFYRAVKRKAGHGIGKAFYCADVGAVKKDGGAEKMVVGHARYAGLGDLARSLSKLRLRPGAFFAMAKKQK